MNSIFNHPWMIKYYKKFNIDLSNVIKNEENILINKKKLDSTIQT